MAIVESGKEYVLQWTGHAAHVTERFSGLLARQALVDVTLICQGQKLRVHKLVLASSSLYFEEMLEQDLGQEPIILLRDLDFEVLKAMVEFMYCGETTISQCHLQTLLDAAQVFKVKELKRIVETMIKSKPSGDKVSSDDEVSPTSCRTETMNCKARPSGERCDEKSLPRDLEESEISETKIDRTLDNNTGISYTDEESSLYEIAERADEQNASLNKHREIGESEIVSLDTLDGELLKVCASEDAAEGEESTDDLELPSLTEDNPISSLCSETRCCEFMTGADSREDSSPESATKYLTAAQEVGECSRVYTPKKRKLESDEWIEEEAAATPLSNLEANITTAPKPSDKAAGKNLKVYTHKRRKSMDEKRSQIFENVCDSREETSLGTSSIDLNDESSSNESPIDISTATLDMETSEYIWSLSTETIQNVVGCTINSANFSSTDVNPETVNSEATRDNFHKTSTPDPDIPAEPKESFSCENGHADISETPVLRRSVRINQPETDDSLNNNTGVTNVPKGPEKSLDPDDYPAKTKRRVNRDNNFRVTDENVAETRTVEKSGKSRSLRSASKLSSRASKITRGVVTGRDERTRSARQGRDKPEKSPESSDILVNTRLNTIASVDRALWGDMADVLEYHRDSSEELANYETSREIPFAVGLLPLRAALERMQATVDHQPRKTRSSVAPWRQEATTIRRKFYEFDNPHRKHLENVETAVCHIEIRTSPNRNGHHEPRITTDEQIIAVGTNAESNDQ